MTAYDIPWLIDTSAYIIFWLWIAVLILTFLVAVRAIYRHYWPDEPPHTALEKGAGDPAEEADAAYTGWKPKEWKWK